MDKNAIKKYAVWARRELISRVSGRAAWYGITEDSCVDADADSIDGRILSTSEKKQRSAIISKVQHEGYEQTVEEVAYTWFNRFCALRYMEVNGYLPSHIRVFTDDANEFKPQILDEAIHLEIEGLDKEKVLTCKDINDTEGLYRYLLITQCNALSSILPGMFQKIEDYTELLLPENLLRDGSVIEQMIAEIPEEDWTDQVQIIGWLYQYYNAEKKDEVFTALKKNVKITKENIPAATQLFTPDWIVRYLVENSLGRLWVEGHPNVELKSGWKYYIDEAEQDPEVEKQLAEIQKEHSTMKPEDIKCIDPCCGSGHILVYMFDVLMKIYKSYGYTTQESVISIINNNLYGLDIDERATQLAYFAVMMKARSYDSRFFSRGIQPHVYAIYESNGLGQNLIDFFVGNDSKLKKDFETLVEELRDAKEYGSILTISSVDFSSLYARIDEITHDINFHVAEVINQILPLIRVAEILAQKYDVVVTNPPYMGNNGISPKLAKFVKNVYSNSKNDMFAVFIEHCGYMTKENGYQAMITQQAWMFLSSFEKMRTKLLLQDTVINMVHLGAHAFEEIGGEVVQTTSFVLKKTHIENYIGTYCRLIKPTTQQSKKDMFLKAKNQYTAQQKNFFKIPGVPVAYWVSDNTFSQFQNSPSIGDLMEGCHGLLTGHDEDFIFSWYELPKNEIGFNLLRIEDIEKLSYKFIPLVKGGAYRKWYGNLTLVVRYDDIGRRNMSLWPKYASNGQQFYMKEGITWGEISSGSFNARIMPEGCIFSLKGPCIFPKADEEYQFLGFLCSKVANYLIKIINPTISTGSGVIKKLPAVNYKHWNSHLVMENIKIAKLDWDSVETSWDFKCHPLVRWSRELSDSASIATTMSNYYRILPQFQSQLELCWLLWRGECNDRFEKMKANEEELNRGFINIYGLQEELTPEIEDKEVTVSKADLQRDIKSLISYAVGCMFGRYSLDFNGLAFAGGDWDDSRYTLYQPDHDGILPICDDEYFTDDIVGRFVDFIRTVYGSDTLEENLQFIADALGGKGSSREVIRKYFLNDFFVDHCKIYQKRPIYWLFDSGKKNGFKCLIYLHRYRPDTIARIRTDYVHEQQARYRTAIADLENRIETASTSDRIKLNKELKKVQEQSDELHNYEEKIHHLADQYIVIDLDDGVKVNYAKFQDVLAKIK